MWDEPFVFCFLVSSSYSPPPPLGMYPCAPFSPLVFPVVGDVKPFMTLNNISLFVFLSTFFSSGDSELSTITGGALSRT